MDELNKLFFILVIIMCVLSLLNSIIKIYNRIAEKKVKKKLFCFNEDIEQISDRKYRTLFIAILLLGLFIRTWKFGIIPAGFNQDGAFSAVDGKALADYGTDRYGTFMPAHLYGWGYSQMSSLLSYLIAILVKLFGLNEITARLPLLIFSMIGATCFSLLMKDSFGKRVGLISAFLVCINPWHFLQSRWALDCNLFAHFFIIGVYFFNKGLNDKKRYIYISMIFFALSMYSYGVAIYTIPFFLAIACLYYMIRKKLKIKEVAISALVYLLIAWPFIATMAINYFKIDTIKLPFVTLQYFSESVRASDILFFCNDPKQQIISNMKSLINIIIFQKNDWIFNGMPGFATLYTFTMPFFFLGFIELFRNKECKSKGLFIIALATGIWCGLITNDVNISRINVIYYEIMMFMALGIYFTIREIKYIKYIDLCMWLVAGVMLINTYFGDYAESVAREFRYGFGEAVKIVEEMDVDKIYVTADNYNSLDASRALLMFYTKMDAKYFQGKTNISNGKELLPYNKRYKYYTSVGSIKYRDLEDKKVAYIIKSSEKYFFDTEKFKIQEFGNYALVTKK